MANVVVVGSQWGDEGKGKIVDWLSEQADIVVRFQGGHMEAGFPSFTTAGAAQGPLHEEQGRADLFDHRDGSMMSPDDRLALFS